MSRHDEHHPHKQGNDDSLVFSILTVSSSRGLEEDSSGDVIADLVVKNGHRIGERRISPDETSLISEAVKNMVSDETDVVIIDGGTGVTPKDVTVEAVEPLFEKEMTGFATLFTHMSYEEIGPAAILSRACAGILGKTAIFCMPGSTKACELAMNRIILPEATHLMAHVKGKV